MIEANDEEEHNLKSETNNYLIALLGSESKEVDFYMPAPGNYSTGCSIYRENTPPYSDDNVIIVKKDMKRLDDIFKCNTSASTPGFDLIKLDTQGSELDILKGGEKLCKRAKVIILEVSLVEYNLNSPLKEEVLDFMDSFGFYTDMTIGEHYGNTETTQFDGLVQEDIVFINKEYPF